MADTGATYFIKVFGSQRRGNRPKFSHTFATFTKQEMQSDGTVVRQAVTISWLPRDGQIKPLGGPEPGRNYTLDQTFTWLDDAGSDLRWESPDTETQPRLFDTAVVRFNELQHAALQYIMIDNLLLRPHEASNCIHAVTDLPLALDMLGMSYTGTLHGISASRFVYQYLSPFYVSCPESSVETEQLFGRAQREHLGAAMAAEDFLERHKALIGEGGL